MKHRITTTAAGALLLAAAILQDVNAFVPHQHRPPVTFLPHTTTASSSSSRVASRDAANVVAAPPTGSSGGISVNKPLALFGRRTTSSRSSKKHLTIVYMGWGPDPIWTTSTIKSNVDACPSGSCVSVTVSVPSETATEYTVPGQYVQVKVADDDDAKPIFLAIASPPTAAEGEEKKEEEGGEAEFEFLIKKTDNNDWITTAQPGTTIDVSQVLGNGFPMSENFEGFKYDFPTQNVLLFAAGSGIAPIKSAIESGLLNVAPAGSGGRTSRLYYGVRTLEDMPYVELFGKWEELGVEVVPVVSQPEGCVEVWEGRTGYVQNALEEDGVPIPRNSGALMCGMKGMAEAVKDVLVKAGVFEGRVLTNF